MARLKFRALLFMFAFMTIALAICAWGVSLPGSRSKAVSCDEFMWYYLPHDTDEQPEPMEKAPYVKDHNVLYIGPADKKSIYLTFDDCPDNDNIPKILDVLKKHNAPAAFFMTEDYIRKHPDIIKKISDDGHLVCNHTSHHVGVCHMPLEKLEAELKGVEDAYREVTGRELARFFRPPQGKFSEKSLGYTEQLGYITVFWSFRYIDWEICNQPSEDRAFNIMMKETHPGEIVLLHCQSSTNVKILDRVMTAWEDMGYAFGTLDDIPVNAPQAGGVS